MALVSISIPFDVTQEPLVLVVDCHRHPGSVLLKVATFDGGDFTFWTDGTYWHDEDDGFGEFVGPDDAAATEALRALGVRLDAPPVAEGAGYWRYRLRCPRPSCGIDQQARGEALGDALHPLLKVLWARGVRGEITLDEAGALLGVRLRLDDLLARARS